MKTMTNFKEYKNKKQKAEKEKRAELMKEMSEIDFELIESLLPEEEKVSYKFLEKRKEEEFCRLLELSIQINGEARMIFGKWKQDGFFGE